MNGLAGYYVSTIGKPYEYFDLTRSKTPNQRWIDFLRSTPFAFPLIVRI